jgi:FkbM family methyltransferase
MKNLLRRIFNRLCPRRRWLSHEVRLRSLRASGVSLRRVLDIGAFDGNWTRLVRRHFPDAEVTMVEANRDKEPVLRPLGTVHVALLADVAGRLVDYYRCQDGDTGSGNGIYRENTAHRFAPEKRTTETLDGLFGSAEPFDLIKMDVQGAELDVIKGGLPVIRRTRHLLLELQTWDYNLGAPRLEEVVAFLHAEGFGVTDVFDLMYSGDRLIQVDLLFHNRSLT